MGLEKDIWLSPKGIFRNGFLTTDCAVRITGGVVHEIATKSFVGDATIEPVDGILSNGLIDLQVNGGGGVLFNTNPTKEGIEAIIAAHRRYGTASLLPTVISDTEAVLQQAVEAVFEAWGLRGLAGIHIEGPHISASKRGTHAAEVLRPLGKHTLALVGKLRQAAIPTMITVAPEVVTPYQIAQLVDMGAVVSLGHSDADYKQTYAALEAGASCFTHLFNAMSQMTSREPGMVGAALSSKASAGFICDGHHVDDATLSVALSVERAKERLFLVSDAMPTVGGPDGFSLYGMEVRLEGGKLVNRDGNLAGAHVTMAESVSCAVIQFNLSIEEALRMAIATPAAVLGLVGGIDILDKRPDELLVWSNGLEECRWLNLDGLEQSGK